MPAADEVLGRIIDWLSEDGLNTVVYVRKKVFLTDAWVFLEFAKTDLQNPDARGMTNALGNAKRAIENRIDTLLFANGFRARAKKEGWNFPKKRDKLRLLGIAAPRLLQRMVTSRRNLLEHEYEIPTNPEDVQDVIDIAEMYLGSTQADVDRGFLRLVVGPSGLDEGQLSERDYSVPAEGRFSIVMDAEADRLLLRFGTESLSVRLRGVGEEELRRLLRSLRLVSETPGLTVVGPIDEEDFFDRFIPVETPE